MALDKRDIERALKSKGFGEARGSHRYFTYYFSDGRKGPAKTMTSHGPRSKSIDRPRMIQMAKQCRLTPDEFVALVECPLNREDYERILEDRGFR